MVVSLVPFEMPANKGGKGAKSANRADGTDDTNGTKSYMEKLVALTIASSIEGKQIRLWFWVLAATLFEPCEEANDFRRTTLAVLLAHIAEMENANRTNTIFVLWKTLAKFASLFHEILIKGTFDLSYTGRIPPGTQNPLLNLEGSFNSIFGQGFLVELKKLLLMDNMLVKKTFCSVILMMHSALHHYSNGIVERNLFRDKIDALKSHIVSNLFPMFVEDEATACKNPFVAAIIGNMISFPVNARSCWEAVSIVRKTSFWPVFWSLTVIRKMIAKVAIVPQEHMPIFFSMLRHDDFKGFFRSWTYETSAKLPIARFVKKLVIARFEHREAFEHWLWKMGNSHDLATRKFLSLCYHSKEGYYLPEKIVPFLIQHIMLRELGFLLLSASYTINLKTEEIKDGVDVNVQVVL